MKISTFLIEALLSGKKSISLEKRNLQPENRHQDYIYRTSGLLEHMFGKKAM